MSVLKKYSYVVRKQVREGEYKNTVFTSDSIVDLAKALREEGENEGDIHYYIRRPLEVREVKVGQ